MKTAEDFRKSIGKADEDFLQGIRQTLTVLEWEEEQPVKRKISMGLVLAVMVMLVTVTALAAGSWGILDFIREQGKKPAEYKLVMQVPQEISGSHWVDMTIDEAMVDGGKAYLAMTVKPKTENTIIVPRVMNIAVPGGMAVMNNPAHDMNLSVKEFAESRGFEKILGFRPPMGLSLVGLKNAKYESMEDGSLRCMLEYDFAPEEETFPEQRLLHIWEVIVVEYREDDISPDHIRVSPSQNLQILAELQVNISPQTRKSREANAHELAGYDSTIDYMTVTPREDGGVQFTMMVDTDGRHLEGIKFFTENRVPMVLPDIDFFAINLNKLHGDIPNWLKYHPKLDYWFPLLLVFPQEGKDAAGNVAGFNNVPTNLNYYYEIYKNKKWSESNIVN